ncbi:glucose-1-phosphate adenylyltransferase family protein [Jannaschia sp. R86511]|uniref:glucose-1-phosphate adenylyltransferase family protein n=1 Tax=Jannaschia sp. R86511 TaxID=3093853 RepID=UPI0036D20E75
MSLPRVLVLVLAGGAGSRLELLTQDRPKPAVPFGASFRLVDFALSSCAHSGVSDVWVLQQHTPGPLSEHLANGRPWDLDRTRGGLMVVHPHEGDHREGFHTGTADALWKTATSLREADPEVVVLVSADAVYRLDYLDVALAHRDSGAAMTAVTVAHDGDNTRYGVVEVADGTVTGYAYKPEQPATDLIATEVFALSPGPVLDLLDELAQEVDDLGDLGDHLLPRLVADGSLREHRFTGYWQDVGTVEAYWRTHMELLGPRPPFDLDDPAWPLLTQPGRHAPAKVSARAEVADSLLGPGSSVRGTVRRSVLSTGVVVEAGAHVVDSVLLPGAVVRAGARVERAVLDSEVVVGRDAVIGGPGADDDEVALVGRGAHVEPGTSVPPGGRLPAPDAGA